MPTAAATDLGRAGTASEVGDDQHCRRCVGQTAQAFGERGVYPGGGAFWRRDHLDGAVASAIGLRRFAAAGEIARVRDRRTPVISETLEVREGKRGEILTGDGDDSVPAQRIEQDGHLLRRQRLAQIQTGQSDSGTTAGQRAVAVGLCAEGKVQAAA